MTIVYDGIVNLSYHSNTFCCSTSKHGGNDSHRRLNQPLGLCGVWQPFLCGFGCARGGDISVLHQISFVLLQQRRCFFFFFFFLFFPAFFPPSSFFIPPPQVSDAGDALCHECGPGHKLEGGDKFRNCVECPLVGGGGSLWTKSIWYVWILIVALPSAFALWYWKTPFFLFHNQSQWSSREPSNQTVQWPRVTLVKVATMLTPRWERTVTKEADVNCFFF